MSLCAPQHGKGPHLERPLPVLEFEHHVELSIETYGGRRPRRATCNANESRGRLEVNLATRPSHAPMRYKSARKSTKPRHSPHASTSSRVDPRRLHYRRCKGEHFLLAGLWLVESGTDEIDASSRFSAVATKRCYSYTVPGKREGIETVAMKPKVFIWNPRQLRAWQRAQVRSSGIRVERHMPRGISTSGDWE